MMTGLLLLLWGSFNRLTWDRVVVATLCSAFIGVVVPCFEEPRLVEEFGRGYAQYKQVVTTMFIPYL